MLITALSFLLLVMSTSKTSLLSAMLGMGAFLLVGLVRRGPVGAVAATWTALGPGGWATARAGSLAAAFDPDRLGELAAFAMERAKSAGASYADIRINRYRDQAVGLRELVGPEARNPDGADSAAVYAALRLS